MRRIARVGATAACLACAGITYAQTSRISGPKIESNRGTVSIGNHVSPFAQTQFDRGPVDPALPIPVAMIHLLPTAAQQAELDAFLKQQQDKSSPNYHHWLTPEEFGDRFGLSGNDLAKIGDWLKSHGLQVYQTARGRRWIGFSGTARQIGAVFHTELHHYEVNGKLHYANATAPMIPAQLDGIVGGIYGLDDFDWEPVSSIDPQYTTSSGAHYIAPEDFATMYDLNPLYNLGFDGTGQKIAIGGRTDISLSDVRAFRKRFGLPANDPQPIQVPYLPDPGVSGGDVGEAQLDVQWSGAVARNASILYVYSPNVFSSVQYAIDQNLAPVVSVSYGGCELGATYATVDFLRGTAQQASAQGITWVAAAGDSGAAACDRQGLLTEGTRGLAVSAPASIPEVTGVGGTELDDSAGNYWNAITDPNGGSLLGYAPERAWNDSYQLLGLASGGGGASVLFPKPAWQTGAGVPSDNARDVPDVSLAASAYHDPYLFYLSGNLGAVGGTSVSAPSFAGILAILNQYLVSQGTLKQAGLGNINPVVYRMAQSSNDVFHDIVNGDNIIPCAQDTPDCGSSGSFGYSAGPGYDLATGLGSIDANHLVTEWSAGSASAIAVSASLSSVAYNGTLQVSAVVSGGASTPTGTVSFLLGDTPLGSADLQAGTAALNVSAFQLPAGANTIKAVYGGDGVYSGSTGSTTINVTVTAGAAAIAPTITPDPIYVSPPDSNGLKWDFTITLTEKAGVSATLTSLTVLGANLSPRIVSFFGTSRIPANGSISAPIDVNLNPVPSTGIFLFSGTDANGHPWSAQTTAQFVTTKLQAPWMSVSTVPGTGNATPSSDPSCAFQDTVILEENSGNGINLNSFRAGTSDLSDSIQGIFGTTHLAPYGTLSGPVCWSQAPSGMYTSQGVTENGATVTGSAAVTAIGAAANLPNFAVSPSAVALSGSNSSAAVSLNFSGAAPAWSLSIAPSNRVTTWLTASATSGTGSAQITLTANAAGLANGAYYAFVNVQAPGALPQFISIPVSFVVGSASGISIGGVVNGASFQNVAAPGMVLSVFGTGLAPGVAAASSLPLPISLLGVTATVNGVTAPLRYVSSGQVNLDIPYETGSGWAMVGINNNGKVAAFTFYVSESAPGIFAGSGNTLVPNSSGKRGDTLSAFITGQGDISPSLYTGRTASSSTPLANLPSPTLPVTVSVGGINAQIAFLGIPSGLVETPQINFVIPANAPLGNQPVVVTVGGVSSPAVMLNVTQ